MENSYSRTDLLRFIDHIIEKGLVKPETGKAWKVAASKVLEDLSEAEEADVRKVDIDAAIKKFANRNFGKYKSESLNVYRSRLNSTIDEFVRFVEDPASYKPHGQIRSRNRSEVKSTERGEAKGREDSKPKPVASSVRMPQISSGLSLDYPIRSDFLAQVVVPRDLTLVEARRLGAFLLTLAADFQPNDGG